MYEERLNSVPEVVLLVGGDILPLTARCGLYHHVSDM